MSQQFSPYPPAPTPGYGMVSPYAMKPEHPDSTLVLILGVVSLFAVVTGPFAWYYGSRARAQMAREPHRWAPSTQLTIGWVLGILCTVGVALGIAAIVLFIFLAATA